VVAATGVKRTSGSCDVNEEGGMKVAVFCIGELGLLVFGLGLVVSLLRGSTGTNIGHKPDPTDRLYKMVRAHANAAEYGPMLAVLMLVLGARQPGAGMVVTFVIATFCRYLHAAGMILSPSLERPQPLRFIGALGTYITGLVLVAATLFS
jgi:uncharacterized protein